MKKIFKNLILISAFIIVSLTSNNMSAQIKIKKAIYGYTGNVFGMGAEYFDVKYYFEAQAMYGFIKVRPNMNAEVGDPAEGRKKETVIKWEDDGKKMSKTVAEGETFLYLTPELAERTKKKELIEQQQLAEEKLREEELSNQEQARKEKEFEHSKEKYII